MNKKFKKQYPKIVLLLLIACISLGYGALTSNLTIIGTSNINNASWDVHWNNVQVTSGSVTGTNVTTAAHILTGATQVEYSITLGTPGDFYEFTVDAVNAGSIDAMIGSFSNKVYQSNGTTERTLPDYLTYSVTYRDGAALASNHLLAANTTETYKVRVEFKTDINASQLPSSQDTLVFKFNVSYVQADSNAVEKPILEPYTVNLYPTIVNLGSYIPLDVTIYKTYQEAVTAFGHNFFLKHKKHSINALILESYAGFVLNGHDYYLRGGGSTDNSEYEYFHNFDSIYYTDNKSTLVNAFGSSNCQIDQACGTGCLHTFCANSNLGGEVFNDGRVYIGDNNGNYCAVIVDQSACQLGS